MRLAQAFVRSKGLCNASVRLELSLQEARGGFSAVMRIFRAVACHERGKQLLGSDDDVCPPILAPQPLNLVRLARLRFLNRIIRCRFPAFLTSTLASAWSTRSWIKAVRDHFRWAASRQPKLEELKEVSFATWCKRVRNARSAFNILLKDTEGPPCDCNISFAIRFFCVDCNANVGTF